MRPSWTGKVHLFGAVLELAGADLVDELLQVDHPGRLRFTLGVSSNQ